MQIQLVARSDAFLHRFGWLLPLVSFGLGWTSLVLIQRGEDSPKLMAAPILAGWVWLLAQSIMRNLHSTAPRCDRLAASLATQAVQQTILFFSLPFLALATTLTDYGQVLVTAGVALAAVASAIDPLYQRYIAGRQLPGLAFHCLCSFIAALVVLPIVVKIPVELGFNVAIVCVLLWLVCAAPLHRRHQEFSLRILALALCFPLLACALRSHIPAAGIRLDQSVLTTKVVGHEPQDHLTRVDPAVLARGVYVHASISAPLGLSRQVIFNWRHGDYAERVPSTISGGRVQGYRTYSYKRNFTEDATGPWTVDILTPQGQLLGRVEFEVDAALAYDVATVPQLVLHAP